MAKSANDPKKRDGENEDELEEDVAAPTGDDWMGDEDDDPMEDTSLEIDEDEDMI
jgi:hypothetical protein